jgi:hypothetical protein
MTPEEQRQRLLDLAKRCETGEGPDRDLDAEIACAIHGYTMHKDSKPAEHGVFAFWDKAVCINCSSWPNFTGSLVEAADLLPGDVILSTASFGVNGIQFSALVPPDGSAVFGTHPNSEVRARCSLALRARAALA